MNTAENLRQEFGTQFPRLERVAEVYLNVTASNNLSTKAAQGQIPFPIFKASTSNKAPWLVDVKELAKYLDKLSRKAAEENRAA